MSDFNWPEDETVAVELTVDQWARLAYAANQRKDNPPHHEPQRIVEFQNEWDGIIGEIDKEVTESGYSTVHNNF